MYRFLYAQIMRKHVSQKPSEGFTVIRARHKQNFTVANLATNYHFTVAKPDFTVARNTFV